MSAVSGAKSASRRLADEVLGPLLARLTTLRASVSEQDRALLEKIERELAELKDVVSHVEETEKQIRYSFDPIERHIDDALQAAPVAAHGVRPKLSAALAEMDIIKAKVRAAYNLSGDGEGSGAGGQGQSAPPHPRHAADLAARNENDAMEMIRRSPAMRHLRLVVGGLDESLRSCALCLAAFPEGDAAVKKRLLTDWWIAEGFAGSTDEAERRFEELVGMGFLTPLRKPHCGKIHQCKMPPPMQHQLLADLARRSAFIDADLSRARRAILQRGGSGGEAAATQSSRFDPEAVPYARRRDWEAAATPSSRFYPGVRTMSQKHVQLGEAAAAAATPSSSSRFNFNPGVRTIYNVSLKYVQLGEAWFAGKKELRALQLGQWRHFGPREQIADPNRSHIEVSGTEYLEDLGQCTSLRYVSFRGISRIQSLPSSIGKLRELVVLDLRACHDLEELGQGITKLSRLQYLDLSECHLLIGVPKGIGRLTRLEVLKGFVIANINCKDPCRLHELTELERLRKLSITIGKMAAPAADEFKKLGELKALRSLTLVWGVQRDESPSQNSAPVSAMEFALPPDLEKLDLRGFPLPSFQRWARPKDVKKLYIRGGNLRTLGDDEDWQAQVLQLRFLKYFRSDHERLRRSFRSMSIVVPRQKKMSIVVPRSLARSAASLVAAPISAARLSATPLLLFHRRRSCLRHPELLTPRSWIRGGGDGGGRVRKSTGGGGRGSLFVARGKQGMDWSSVKFPP